jgi:hypothetical protein
MVTRQRLRFVGIAVLWTSVTLVLLVALGIFSFELLVLVAFVGLLITAEMTAPTTIVIEWRKTVRLFIVVGGVLFAVFAGRIIVEMFPFLST